MFGHPLTAPPKRKMKLTLAFGHLPFRELDSNQPSKSIERLGLTKKENNDHGDAARAGTKQRVLAAIREILVPGRDDCVGTEVLQHGIDRVVQCLSQWSEAYNLDATPTNQFANTTQNRRIVGFRVGSDDKAESRGQNEIIEFLELGCNKNTTI